MMDKDNIIKANEHVFIKMPSDNVKSVVLKPGSTVSLGKFGSFKANDIIGHPYGSSYEIYDHDNKTRLFYAEEMDEIDETANNNREIKDDGSSQKLSFEEINALKADGLKGKLTAEEIIQKLKDSNQSFDKKTAYSQSKYLKRKEKKFSKVFTPIQTTSYAVNEYFYVKNPIKIRDLRMDTLSQILSLANVHSGCRMLVVDDTQGMIVSAMAERMDGKGTILGMFDAENANYDIVKYMNFNEETNNVIKTLSWLRMIRGEEDVSPDTLQDPTTLSGNDLDGYNRRMKAYTIVEDARRTLEEGDFDGLVIASQYQAESILEKLLPFVRGSRPVVIYHSSKEALLDTNSWMRRCPMLLQPTLTESWLRKSQVLPGRTHPEMSTWGTGGYLLYATRVIDKPVQASLTKKQRNQKEKDNAEAKRLKRSREEAELASAAETPEGIVTTDVEEGVESIDSEEHELKKAKTVAE